MTSTSLAGRQQTAAPQSEVESLLESIPGQYLVLDPQLTVVAATEAYAMATATRPEELLGRSIFEIFQGRGGEAAEAGVPAAETPSPQAPEVEVIARLQRENEALLRSNQDLRHFAHMAAHDLQAPLRSIAGFTQLLHQACGDGLDEQAGEYMHYVLDNTRRLQTLIQDLLAYSRLESRRPALKPVDLRRVLDDVLTALAIPIQASRADMNCGDLPVVVGDRSQLMSLFMNLVENGIKYRRRDGPRVEIRAERQGTEWLFSVRDDGIGIAPRHHGEIFDMFRRLHSVQAYPGSGIGLAICKRVVDRHGGRIWVESRVGEGSTFRFTLPASEPADPRQIPNS